VLVCLGNIVRFVENKIFMKDIEKFKIEYSKLINEMYERMSKPEEKRYIIDDGVMLPEKYFSNEIRLAWMLKEPYDEKDGTGGGWSYFEMFKGENLYLEQFNRTNKPTWHPIIYISFAIHNHFLKWNQMGKLRDNNEMCEVVKEVAFINAQKLPSKNGTTTNFSDLFTSLEKYNDLIIRQIDLLNPNVFIFANTFDVYKKYLNLENSKQTTYKSLRYVVNDGKLYINAYHPAQKTIKGFEYGNDIIDIVEKWKKNEIS
jgi:hypothetical protein